MPKVDSFVSRAALQGLSYAALEVDETLRRVLRRERVELRVLQRNDDLAVGGEAAPERADPAAEFNKSAELAGDISPWSLGDDLCV